MHYAASVLEGSLMQAQKLCSAAHQPEAGAHQLMAIRGYEV
jgi:hypothetical protein